MATIDDFKKLDLRVAKVLEVKEHPNADKLYLLSLEVGDERRQVVAGIRPYYKPEELEGKFVVVVANLEKATIRGEESCGMVLAAKDDETLGVLTFDRVLKTGSRIS